MKIAGIIAEYNPFHRGHRYQLETLRRRYRPDYVIIAMSGDFLQRGTCALMDKYARARMALLQGADLILELPACFAAASAELFARGGVLLFETTGLMNCLCFGAESGDLKRLEALAGLLINEPEWYRKRLRQGLKQGLSFPSARAKALPEYADLLELPNNILALEYLKAIGELAPGMEPVLIQRKGSGYHDMELTGPFASASAIRRELLASHCAADEMLPASDCVTGEIHLASDCMTDGKYLASAADENWRAPEILLSKENIPNSIRLLPKELQNALPAESFQILEAYQKEAAFLTEDDFSLLLHHALLRETPDSLLRYEDVTEALANRFLRRREHFLSWSQFCQICDSKDMTSARISRALTHLLLGIEKESLDPYRRQDRPATPGRPASPLAKPGSSGDRSGSLLPAQSFQRASALPYLRVLGFRSPAAPLLAELKKRAKAPVLYSLASAGELLCGPGLSMLKQDVYASDLYRSVLTARTGKSFPTEYRRKLLTV